MIADIGGEIADFAGFKRECIELAVYITAIAQMRNTEAREQSKIEKEDSFLNIVEPIEDEIPLDDIPEEEVNFDE